MATRLVFAGRWTEKQLYYVDVLIKYLLCFIQTMQFVEKQHNLMLKALILCHICHEIAIEFMKGDLPVIWVHHETFFKTKKLPMHGKIGI